MLLVSLNTWEMRSGVVEVSMPGDFMLSLAKIFDPSWAVLVVFSARLVGGYRCSAEVVGRMWVTLQ